MFVTTPLYIRRLFHKFTTYAKRSQIVEKVICLFTLVETKLAFTFNAEVVCKNAISFTHSLIRTVFYISLTLQSNKLTYLNSYDYIEYNIFPLLVRYAM